MASLHGILKRTQRLPSYGQPRNRLTSGYINYADDISEPLCDEIVNFVFVGGGSGSMSRGDILLHVVNHTTYHRGHIADMIYQIPASPPTTDLPVFLRDDPLALP